MLRQPKELCERPALGICFVADWENNDFCQNLSIHVFLSVYQGPDTLTTTEPAMKVHVVLHTHYNIFCNCKLSVEALIAVSAKTFQD